MTNEELDILESKIRLGAIIHFKGSYEFYIDNKFIVRETFASMGKLENIQWADGVVHQSDFQSPMKEGLLVHIKTRRAINNKL